jgi:hypothetical protein
LTNPTGPFSSSWLELNDADPFVNALRCFSNDPEVVALQSVALHEIVQRSWVDFGG